MTVPDHTRGGGPGSGGRLGFWLVSMAIVAALVWGTGEIGGRMLRRWAASPAELSFPKRLLAAAIMYVRAYWHLITVAAGAVLYFAAGMFCRRPPGAGEHDLKGD